MAYLLASVIIPFFNNRRILNNCLQSLKQQTLQSGSLEIILVDDGSTEHISHFIELPDHTMFLCQPNQGPAAARNRGIDAAKGDILLFTDSDCLPDPDWAEQLLKCLEDSSISGAKGVYRTEQKELTARFVQLEYQTKYRYMSQFEYIDFIDTYSAAYRKSALEHERFDESFPKASVEDQELSFRLAQQGHKFKFCPAARVRHTHVASPLGYFRKKFKIGFWKAKILYAQKRRLGGDSHTPKALRLEMLLAPFLLISWVYSPLLWLVVLSAFLLCSLPLFCEAWRADFALIPTIPFFTLLRAFGLGFGLACGLLYFGGRLLHRRVLPFF